MLYHPDRVAVVDAMNTYDHIRRSVRGQQVSTLHTLQDGLTDTVGEQSSGAGDAGTYGSLGGRQGRCLIVPMYWTLLTLGCVAGWVHRDSGQLPQVCYGWANESRYLASMLLDHGCLF
jgi:hypothetical protein